MVILGRALPRNGRNEALDFGVPLALAQTRKSRQLFDAARESIPSYADCYACPAAHSILRGVRTV